MTTQDKKNVRLLAEWFMGGSSLHVRMMYANTRCLGIINLLFTMTEDYMSITLLLGSETRATIS